MLEIGYCTPKGDRIKTNHDQDPLDEKTRVMYLASAKLYNWTDKYRTDH